MSGVRLRDTLDPHHRGCVLVSELVKYARNNLPEVGPGNALRFRDALTANWCVPQGGKPGAAMQRTKASQLGYRGHPANPKKNKRDCSIALGEGKGEVGGGGEEARTDAHHGDSSRRALQPYLHQTLTNPNPNCGRRATGSSHVEVTGA